MATSLPDNSNLPLINRPQTLLGVVITFLIIGIVAISLRLWVRFRAQIWWWDDLCVFLAGLSTTIGSSLTCSMPDYGMGKHFWTLDEGTVMQYFKHIWSTNLAYTFSTTFIKLAILLQYLRLFDMQIPIARRITWCLIVAIFLWGATFFLLALFACHPIAKNWNFDLPGTCVAWGSKNANIFFATWAAHSASNMFWDICVLLLPIPFLKSLRVQGRTRIGLMALFTMGGIVACLSIARMVALSIKRAGTVPVFDPSYSTPAIYICSVLEVNIAILCASIPIFWPLVTSLSGNKILVVQEIEVRTDARDSRGLALAEQGAHNSGYPDKYDDNDMAKGRTTMRTSMVIAGKDNGVGNIINMNDLRKSKSHSRTREHRSKPSTSSSHHSIFNHHHCHHHHRSTSRESQRGLAHHVSHSSIGSIKHDGGLELSEDGTVARYKDPYMQDWAVPDFDKDFGKREVLVGGGSSTAGATAHPTFTTTVERAEIPFDHIKALER